MCPLVVTESHFAAPAVVKTMRALEKVMILTPFVSVDIESLKW